MSERKDTKIWRLTLLIGNPEFRRRCKIAAADKNMSLQEFGVMAIEAAIKAVEAEKQQEQSAA